MSTRGLKDTTLAIKLEDSLGESLILLSKALKMTPSQVVEWACRDFIKKSNVLEQETQPSYCETKAREEAMGMSFAGSVVSSPISFRPLRRGAAEGSHSSNNEHEDVPVSSHE